MWRWPPSCPTLRHTRGDGTPFPRGRDPREGFRVCPVQLREEWGLERCLGDRSPGKRRAMPPPREGGRRALCLDRGGINVECWHLHRSRRGIKSRAAELARGTRDDAGFAGASSRLCLGTMQFGERIADIDARLMLDRAREHGINFFDTAEMYPVPQRAATQGASERILGRWLRDRAVPRRDVVLATKVTGPSGQMAWIRDGPERLDGASITEAVEGSLRRMQTDYVDLIQLHWPDRYVPMFGEELYDASRRHGAASLEDQLEALGRLKDQGKVLDVGLSNETPWGLMRCAVSPPHTSLPPTPRPRPEVRSDPSLRAPRSLSLSSWLPPFLSRFAAPAPHLPLGLPEGGHRAAGVQPRVPFL